MLDEIFRESVELELSWMSLAYIDAGVFLVESIINDDFPDSSHRSLVPLFLIHQGLELLYKSALKFKQGAYPTTHDLRKLRAQFEEHFPEFSFHVPEHVLGKESVSSASSNVIQHERLRYPTNRREQFWSNTSEVELADIVESLPELQKASLLVWLHIRG